MCLAVCTVATAAALNWIFHCSPDICSTNGTLKRVWKPRLSFHFVPSGNIERIHCANVHCASHSNPVIPEQCVISATKHGIKRALFGSYTSAAAACYSFLLFQRNNHLKAFCAAFTFISNSFPYTSIQKKKCFQPSSVQLFQFVELFSEPFYSGRCTVVCFVHQGARCYFNKQICFQKARRSWSRVLPLCSPLYEEPTSTSKNERCGVRTRKTKLVEWFFYVLKE